MSCVELCFVRLRLLERARATCTLVQWLYLESLGTLWWKLCAANTAAVVYTLHVYQRTATVLSVMQYLLYLPSVAVVLWDSHLCFKFSMTCTGHVQGM